MIEITEQLLKEFLDLCDEFAIWKYFPSGKDRGTFAVSLADWCKGHIERAEWLVSRKAEFDEYPGPKTLRQLIKDKFEPAGELAEYSALKGAEVKCGFCGDSGLVWQADRNSYRWCECEEGIRTQGENPDWLKFSELISKTSKDQKVASRG